MSLCTNLIRVIKAIFTQDDRGCTFVDIMQIIGEQDRNLTPEDMSDGDILTAILAGTEAGLLSEKGDRVFVVKTGAKHAQNSGHVDAKVVQEEADDDICLAKIKRNVTNPYTIMIDLAKPRRADKVREWLNDNGTGCIEYNTDDEELLSPIKVNNSSVDTHESVKEMTLAQSPGSQGDVQETLPRQVLRESATKAGNRNHAKSSENLGQQKSDVRETKMGAKRMAADSKDDVQPPTKQGKSSNVSMSDTMADKDGRKGRFGANGSRSVPTHASCEPADQHEDDLTATQREFDSLNVDIIRYARKMFQHMSTGFDKDSIENKMTNTAVGSQEPNEIAFQCDEKHTPLLPSLQERNANLQGAMSAESRPKIGNKMADNNKMSGVRNKMADNNKMSGVRNTHQLVVTAVHTEKYNPLNECLKSIRLSQEEIAKFDLEGVRNTHQLVVTAVHTEKYNPLNECLKSIRLSQEEIAKFDLEGVRAPSHVGNESVWFGGSKNNVGYFYKYESSLDEHGEQLDTLKAGDASQDRCEDGKR